MARPAITVCFLLVWGAIETFGTAAPPTIASPNPGTTQVANMPQAKVQRPLESPVTTRLDIPPIVPLTARTLQIAQPIRRLPPNVAADFFSKSGSLDHGIGAHRSWAPSGIAWQASAVHYRPLYFQDVSLERHGVSFGIVQPAISTAYAFGQFLALPALMVLHHPFQRCYPLGY